MRRRANLGHQQNDGASVVTDGPRLTSARVAKMQQCVYERGGGASGATSKLRGWNAAARVRPDEEIAVEDPSASGITATGPSSETRAALAGSVVLRHEQDDSDVRFVAVRWCIGHACSVWCAQVHATPADSREASAQSAAGATISAASWHTNQPYTSHDTRLRSLCMSGPGAYQKAGPLSMPTVTEIHSTSRFRSRSVTVPSKTP